MEKMRQWRYGAEALQPESHAFGPEQRTNLEHAGESAGGPQSRRPRGTVIQAMLRPQGAEKSTYYSNVWVFT